MTVHDQGPFIARSVYLYTGHTRSGACGRGVRSRGREGEGEGGGRREGGRGLGGIRERERDPVHADVACAPERGAISLLAEQSYQESPLPASPGSLRPEAAAEAAWSLKVVFLGKEGDRDRLQRQRFWTHDGYTRRPGEAAKTAKKRPGMGCKESVLCLHNERPHDGCKRRPGRAHDSEKL
jgi:hypothetical protein